MAIVARTYGAARWTGDGWAIHELQPHAIIRLKAVFPRVPLTGRPPFMFDGRDETAADLLWYAQRYPLEMAAEDRERLERSAAAHVQTHDEIEAFFSGDRRPRVFQINGRVRPYQGTAAEAAIRHKALLCGDVVGLGKTLVAIAVMTEHTPAVVVVQTHLTAQWAEQVKRFLGAEVHVTRGTRPYPLPDVPVYVTTYSRIAGWSDVFVDMRPRLLVFDEMQELRRQNSQKADAARAIASAADIRLGLTATPVYNYGDEIFNVVDVLKPGALGTLHDFVREWAPNGRTVTDPQALGAYLRDQHLFLRRTRKEVGRELPAVNSVVHSIGYDNAEAERLDTLARTLAIRMQEGSFVERGQAARELDIMARQRTGVAKAGYVAEYVRVLLEAGEPVVLAGWHREVYEIWLEALAEFNPVMYTGSESPKQKQQSAEAFQRGETNLLILSLRSGVGLDGLQERASIVVFGELDWSPLVHEQVIGRLARDPADQTKELMSATPVTAIYLVSDMGSDPLMVDLLGLKRSQSSGITDPFETPAAQVSDESRIRLLAARFLDRQLASTQTQQRAS